MISTGSTKPRPTTSPEDSTLTQPITSKSIGRVLASRLSLLLVLGCGSDTTVAGARDAGSDRDGAPTESRDTAAPVGEGGVPAIATFNGCTAADYIDRSEAGASRVVAIAAAGLSFTPKCMIIAAGQTVRWEGSLNAHPLEPGNAENPKAGSPNSPIVEASSGTSVEFKFGAKGTFPYYCALHGFGAGRGMSGSIHVRE